MPAGKDVSHVHLACQLLLYPALHFGQLKDIRRVRSEALPFIHSQRLGTF